MADGERKMHYTDYEIQSLFEGLCEQIVDALGIENGRKKLYELFPAFRNEVDMKIQEYLKGNRITHKLDKPSEEIMRICQ